MCGCSFSEIATGQPPQNRVRTGLLFIHSIVCWFHAGFFIVGLFLLTPIRNTGTVVEYTQDRAVEATIFLYDLF